MRPEAWCAQAGVIIAISTVTCAGAADLASVGAAVDWTKATTENVTLTDYKFDPQHIILRQGMVYRLHLVNAGTELHEFTAPEFFKAARLRNPEMLVGSGREVVMPPHQEKDVFLVVLRSGTFALSCDDHDWRGMVGDITVE